MLSSWSVRMSALSSSLPLCHLQILLTVIFYSFPGHSSEMLNALDPNIDDYRNQIEASQYHVIQLLLLFESLIVCFSEHCRHTRWKMYSAKFKQNGTIMSKKSAGKNNYIDIIHSVCLTCFPQLVLTLNNYIFALQFIINWALCHHFLFLFPFFSPGIEISPISLYIFWWLRNLGETSADDQHISYTIYCLIYVQM